MLLYMTHGARTRLCRETLYGLPVWHLTAGRGLLRRWRTSRYLRQLSLSGVRRGILTEEDEALCARWGIAPVDVLGLRLGVLDGLVTALAGDGQHGGAVRLRCGQGGEETARRCAAVLVHRFRYVLPDRDDPAALASLLLRRWGVAAGSGGAAVALTVCTGAVEEATAAETLYLTEDCARRQQVRYRVPPLPEDTPETLIAALWEAGMVKRAEIRVISVLSSLDRRAENYYNAE